MYIYIFKCNPVLVLLTSSPLICMYICTFPVLLSLCSPSFVFLVDIFLGCLPPSSAPSRVCFSSLLCSVFYVCRRFFWRRYRSSLPCLPPSSFCCFVLFDVSLPFPVWLPALPCFPPPPPLFFFVHLFLIFCLRLAPRPPVLPRALSRASLLRPALCMDWNGTERVTLVDGGVHSRANVFVAVTIKKIFKDGAPKLGWHDTIAYLTIPVILIVTQSVSMKIMQPAKDPSAPVDESQQASQNASFIQAIDWLHTGGFVGWLVGPSVGRSIGRSVGPSVRPWLIGWLVCPYVGWLVFRWSVGRSVGRLVRVRRLTGWLVRYIGRSVGWLVCRSIDRSVGWSLDRYVG